MSHLKQREGEGHHRVDPHIWLSPANAAAAAVAIAGALADLDPDNAVAYHQNKELFLEQLIDMEKDIEALLMPVRSNGFLVLHDSTQYFEKSFGLTTLAIAEPGHDLPAGAGQISSLIATINEKQPSCMVHDEGLGSKLPALLARETGIRIVIIDPLGREISWGQQTYFDLMWALAKQMEECLKEPSPS